MDLRDIDFVLEGKSTSLRYKTSGKQQEYDRRYGERHKAKIEADNAAIHAEDMKKGVFVYADDLPHTGPRKAETLTQPTV